jgi:hypothetical protein
MTKDQLIRRFKSNANMADEQEDIEAYINTLEIASFFPAQTQWGKQIGEFLAIKNSALYDSAYKFTEGFLLTL